MITVDKYIIR